MYMQMTKWQKRYMILFENHVDIKTGEIFDHYFKKNVEHLRRLTKEQRDEIDFLRDKPMFVTPLIRLCRRYKFPSNMDKFLECYVYTGEIDPSLISSNIQIIDGWGKTVTNDDKPSRDLWESYQENVERFPDSLIQQELKIVIGDEVSLEQLRDYITMHWDAIEVGIKAKPKMYERSIFRAHLNAKRDYRLLALLESGLTYDEVALQIQKEYPGYVPHYMAIQKIKSKVNKLRDTTF